VRTRPVPYPSQPTVRKREDPRNSWREPCSRFRQEDECIMSKKPKVTLRVNVIDRIGPMLRFVALVLLSAHANGHRQHESWITLSQPSVGAPIEVIHRVHLGDIVTLLDHWSLPDQSLDNLETLARLTLYAADRLTVTHADGSRISVEPIGAEIQDDYLFIYMTLASDLAPSPIGCTSEFLQDVLPDQVNLIEIDLPWQRSSHRSQGKLMSNAP
jgi:hypothetical protein